MAICIIFSKHKESTGEILMKLMSALIAIAILVYSCGKPKSNRLSREVTTTYVVNGEINRKDVSPTHYPYRLIGKLSKPNGRFCTASLVWKDLILTNAHCISDSRGGLLTGEFKFFLAYHNGEYLSVTTAKPVKWGELNPSVNGRERDWALLRIAKPLGAQYGYFGYSRLSFNQNNANDINFEVEFGGYGSYFDSQTFSLQKSCKHRKVYSAGSLVKHDCDASSGDSGTPLFVCNTERGCRIIAIHSSSPKGANQSTIRLDRYKSSKANTAVVADQFGPHISDARNAVTP